MLGRLPASHREEPGGVGSWPLAREEEATMTRQKHLKALVRARMEKTGESYASARRQIVTQVSSQTSSTQEQFPRHLPGSIPAATGLRVLLANAGIRAPHTRQPLTEAMVFGIAGGIGAGVFAFHYAKE